MPCCSTTSREIQPKNTTTEEKPQQSSCLLKTAAITLFVVSILTIIAGVFGSLGLHGNANFAAFASLGRDAINAMIAGGALLFVVSVTILTKLVCDAQKSGKADPSQTPSCTQDKGLEVHIDEKRLDGLTRQHLPKGVIHSDKVLVSLYAGKPAKSQSFSTAAEARAAIPKGKEMELKDWKWDATEEQRADIARVLERTTALDKLNHETDCIVFEHGDACHLLHYVDNAYKVVTFPHKDLATIEGKTAVPHATITWVLDKSHFERVETLLVRAADHLTEQQNVHLEIDDVKHNFTKEAHQVYAKGDTAIPEQTIGVDNAFITYDQTNLDARKEMAVLVDRCHLGELKENEAFIHSKQIGGAHHLIIKTNEGIKVRTHSTVDVLEWIMSEKKYRTPIQFAFLRWDAVSTFECDTQNEAYNTDSREERKRLLGEVTEKVPPGQAFVCQIAKQSHTFQLFVKTLQNEARCFHFNDKEAADQALGAAYQAYEEYDAFFALEIPQALQKFADRADRIDLCHSCIFTHEAGTIILEKDAEGTASAKAVRYASHARDEISFGSDSIYDTARITWDDHETAQEQFDEVSARAKRHLNEGEAVIFETANNIWHALKSESGELVHIVRTAKNLLPESDENPIWLTWDARPHCTKEYNTDSKLLMERELQLAGEHLNVGEAYTIEISGAHHVIYKTADETAYLVFKTVEEASDHARNFTRLEKTALDFRNLPDGEGDIVDKAALVEKAQKHLQEGQAFLIAFGDGTEDAFGKRYYVVDREGVHGPHPRRSRASQWIKVNQRKLISEDQTWMSWDAEDEAALRRTLDFYVSNARKMPENHYIVVEVGAGFHLLSQTKWSVHPTEEAAQGAIPAGASRLEDTAALSWNLDWEREEKMVRIHTLAKKNLQNGEGFVAQLDKTHFTAMQKLDGNVQFFFGGSEGQAQEHIQGVEKREDLSFLEGVERSTVSQVIRRALATLSDFLDEFDAAIDGELHSFTKENGRWTHSVREEGTRLTYLSEEQIQTLEEAIDSQPDVEDLHGKFFEVSNKFFICSGKQVLIVDRVDGLIRMLTETINFEENPVIYKVIQGKHVIFADGEDADHRSHLELPGEERAQQLVEAIKNHMSMREVGNGSEIVPHGDVWVIYHLGGEHITLCKDELHARIALQALKLHDQLNTSLNESSFLNLPLACVESFRTSLPESVPVFVVHTEKGYALSRRGHRELTIVEDLETLQELPELSDEQIETIRAAAAEVQDFVEFVLATPTKLITIGKDEGGLVTATAGYWPLEDGKEAFLKHAKLNDDESELVQYDENKWVLYSNHKGKIQIEGKFTDEDSAQEAYAAFEI